MNSKRNPIQRSDEPDPGNVEMLEVCVVCDEEIDANMGRACQLNRIRIANRVRGSQGRVSPCNGRIKTDNLRSGSNRAIVLLNQCGLPELCRFYQNLTECHCSRNDSISSFNHPFSYRDYTAAIGLNSLEQINEQICVKEDLAQTSSLRRFSTYSSACSSAHTCLPEPMRRMRGSSSKFGAWGNGCLRLQFAYQSSK